MKITETLTAKIQSIMFDNGWEDSDYIAKATDAILSIFTKEMEGIIGEAKKKMYCSWMHDNTGIEKILCEECTAVNQALSDVKKKLKELK